MPTAVIYGPVPYPIPANHHDAQGGPSDRNFVPRFSEKGYVVPAYEAVMPLDGTVWSPAGTALAWAGVAPAGTAHLSRHTWTGPPGSELLHVRCV
ncbi:MAG: hypothetical protein NTU94_03560 [Planctomycetota bacterium]|nr:hypothetical protein [Planctomycetota bacterium]